MKKYLAVHTRQNKNETLFEKKTDSEVDMRDIAYVLEFSDNDNLVRVLGNVGGIVCANIMPSRKKAVETVKSWNESFKTNGTSFFN